MLAEGEDQCDFANLFIEFLRDFYGCFGAIEEVIDVFL